MGVPLCRGAVMPDDVCPGIRKATERSSGRHFPARSVRPRVPRHTGCARRLGRRSRSNTSPHWSRIIVDNPEEETLKGRLCRKRTSAGRRERRREKRNPAGRRETAGSERRREGIELSGLRPVSGCPLIPCTVTGKSLNTPVFLCELSESRSLAGENPRRMIPYWTIPRWTIPCQTIGDVILWRPASGDSRRRLAPGGFTVKRPCRTTDSASPYRAIFDRQSVPISDDRRDKHPTRHAIRACP